MFGSGGSGFGGFGQQNNNAQQQQQQPGQQQPAGGLFGQPQQQQQPQQSGFGGGGGGGGAFGAQTGGFGASTSGGLFGGGGGGQGQQQPGAATGGFTFGQPASGAQTASPFGQQQQANKPAGTGGFGGFGASTTTPASGFGGFGASTAGQQPNQVQSSPFGGGGASTTTFGAKPAGGGLFGSALTQQPAQTGAFGQQQPQGGGLFGSAGGLGAAATGGMPTQGTSNPAYTPFLSNEKDATGGGSTNYHYTSISCLPAYRAASLEELRLQDYQQGRKTGTVGPGGGGGAFGQPSGSTGFGQQPGQTNSLFGQQQPQGANTGFGANSGGGLFGQSGSNTGGLFGQQQPQSQPAQGGGLFGQQQQQQPQGGGLFGQQQQQQPATGGFSFGQPQQQQQQQPQQQSGFSFGQPQNQQNKPAGGGLFGQSTTGGFGSTGSGGFSFGASQPNQQQQQQQPGSTGFGSGGLFGSNNQQQQKPATGGLFGSTAGTGTGTGTGFGFGASSAAGQTDNKPAFSFGGGGGFGAASSAPGQASTAAPTGGLFGQAPATSQPGGGGLFGNTQANTGGAAGGFSFGGAANNNNQQQQGQQPGQTGGAFGTGASGGLFGNKPATTGGLFGASSTTQPQAGQSAGFSFGGGATNTATNNNAGTGGLFGQTKPAGGGLFGSLGQNNQQQPQQQQQGGLGGSLFGNNNNTNNTAPGGTGGLFGNAGSGGLFGNNNATQQGAGGGGLFGSNNNTTANNNQQGASTGGLFGQSSNFSFGGANNATNNQSNQSGGLFGGGNSLFGGGGQQQNSNLQQQQQQPGQGFNMQASLASNPYGTDSLFGGQAGPLANASPASLGQSQLGNSQQGHLPFNVSMQRSTKKPPPIVAPFRPSPRSSTRITRLRGTTPGGLGLRESTPGREGSPALGNSTSLFHSPSARTSSPAASSIFRGLSDEQPRHLREGSVPISSTPSSLPPQAFVSRPSVKRLVIDDHDGSQVASSATLMSRSSSLFGGAGSTIRGTPPPASFGSRVAFSPALESAAKSKTPSASAIRGGTPGKTTNIADSSVFGGVGSDDSPSKGFGSSSDAADTSLPALKPGKLNNGPLSFDGAAKRAVNSTVSSGSNINSNKKEDALLPLDYYTEPPLSELREWSSAELRSVESFVVGRNNYGSVEFLEPVDLTTVPELGIIPGGIVQLRLKECLVYPEEDECYDDESGEERDGVQPGYDPKRVTKAKRGQGLNQPAVVSLLQCWATDRATRAPIKDADHPRVKQFVSKLTRRQDVDFVEYKAVPGEWTFRVKHFSRYGLDDSEDDDDEGNDGGAKVKGDRKSMKTTTEKRDESDDDEAMESDGAPPRRALDEESEEEEASEEGDNFDGRSSSTMRLSELGGSPEQPRRFRHLRQGTPTSRDATPMADSPSRAWRGRSTSATPQPPNNRQQSEPWAASLGLEPKRLQVMQASFFGQPSQQQQQQQPDTARKQPRPFSLSEKRAEETALASRATFTAPVSSSHPQKKDAAASAAAIAASSSIAVPPPPPRKVLRTDVAQSVIDQGATSLVIDAGASLGRSFRVGWGPGGLFAHSGRPATLRGEKGSATIGASFDEISTVTLERARVFEPADEEANRKRAKRLLELQLQKTIIEGGGLVGEESLTSNDIKRSRKSAGGCPVAYADGNLRFADFVTAFASNEQRSHESLIFRLGQALFDEVPHLDLSKLQDPTEGGPDPRAVIALRRKALLSGWLRLAVSATVENEARGHIAASRPSSAVAFSYLTAHEVERACVACLDSGDVRLATLVAQASSADDETRAEIVQQLATWRTQAVDAHMDEHVRKLFELLSGNVTISAGSVSRSVKDPIDQVPDLFIAKGLDWKRAMGLHLWYQSSPDESLEVALGRYEEAVRASQGQTTAAPLPPHLDKSGSIRLKQMLQNAAYPRDVLFHLIKLYADRQYPLENLCEPLSFESGNGQDVRLAWHLYQLLSRVLSAGDFRDRVEVVTDMMAADDNGAQPKRPVEGNSTRADNLTTAYANQLESMGLWTWSAYVLLHLELPTSRRTAIKALLARNVSKLDTKKAARDDAGEVEPFLLGKLRIPKSWICEAKADNAKATRQDRYREYQLCLEGAAAAFAMAAQGHDVEEDMEQEEQEMLRAEDDDEEDDDGEAAMQEGFALLRRAHDTVVSVLAPEALIRSDLDLILELLQPIQRILSDATTSGSMDQLAGWENGGKIFVDYVACLRNLPRLMAKRRARAQRSNYRFEEEEDDREEEDERLERLGKRVGELIRSVQEDLWSTKIPVEHEGRAGAGFSAASTAAMAEEDGQLLGWRVAKSEMLTTLQNLLRVFTSLDFGGSGEAASEATIGTTRNASDLPIDTEALQASAMEYCRALVGTAA